MKVYLIKKLASLFYKLASMSDIEAANILGVNPKSTKEEINKAYKDKAKKNHPDAGGTEEEMVKLNVARDVLLGGFGYNYNNTDNDYDDSPSSDLSYEEIADIRREIGRDAFNEEFPGWETELKREMGLDQYNKTFEGYDSNYQPEYGPDINLEYLENELHDTIYGEIDFDQLEEKLDSGNSEDRYLILDLVQASSEQIPSILIDLGIDVNNINLYKYKKIFTSKQIKRMVIDVINEKIKHLIKYNKSFFSKNISLFEIVRDYKLYNVFDKDIHLTQEQLNSLNLKKAKDYFSDLYELEKEKFSHNPQNRYSLLNMVKKMKSDDRYMSRLFTMYLESELGFTNVSSHIVNYIIEALRKNGMFEYIFEPFLRS